MRILLTTHLSIQINVYLLLSNRRLSFPIFMPFLSLTHSPAILEYNNRLLLLLALLLLQVKRKSRTHNRTFSMAAVMMALVEAYWIVPTGKMKF